MAKPRRPEEKRPRVRRGGKEPRAPGREPVAIQVEVLLAAGLNLNEVDTTDGVVRFYPSPDRVDVDRLRRRIDVKSWVKIARARRRSATRPLDEPTAEQALAVITKQTPTLLKVRPHVPREVVDDLVQDGVQEGEREYAARASDAIAAMRRLALVPFEGSFFLVSTLSTATPELLLQLEGGNGDEEGNLTDALAELAFWAELVLELGIGLLTVLGLKTRNRVSLGKWINRLADILNRSRRIKGIALKLARKGAIISAKDIFDLLWALWEEGFTWDSLVEALGDIFDISFWGIARLLGKLGARFIPGAGQALLLADIGILLAELIRKLVSRPSKALAGS